MNDQPATEALETEQPNGGENPQEQSTENDSFFIPKDVIGEKSYKAGDKITLEVMGSDEDGDLEVCFPGSEGGDWRDELKSKLTEAGSSDNGKGIE